MRHPLLLGSALLLGGCGGMVADSTIVDDLRVLNIVSEPASPAPGEVPELSALVADPAGDGFDSWVWWCVEAPDGPTCGDGALPSDLPDTTQGGFLTIAAAACLPSLCGECGLPKPMPSGPSSQRIIASRASGASGVVAW